jgi:hypothetical protein
VAKYQSFAFGQQRVAFTTFGEGEFFTTIKYIIVVDIIIPSLSYSFSNAKNKSRFIDSEFGKKEF